MDFINGRQSKKDCAKIVIPRSGKVVEPVATVATVSKKFE
jgi:hypothetical protein